MEKILLAEMTSAEIATLFKEIDTVIIPVGAIEGNGPHLPVSQDMIVAEEIAKRLGEKTGVPVTPTLPYGNSALLMGYPGTVTIRSNVLAEMLKDICRSYAKHGIKKFLILSPHLGNVWPCNIAIDELRDEGLLVVQADWWRLMGRLCSDMAEAEGYPLGHGSELVTSVVMALRPDLVDLSKAVKEAVESFHLNYHYAYYPAVFTFPDYSKITKSGIVGDPSKASKEKGERIIERCMTVLVKLVEDLKKQTP